MLTCPRCKRDCLEDKGEINNKSICKKCKIESEACQNGSQDDIVEMYMENRFNEDLMK